MPGCLPLCRTPTAWCSRLRSVRKPSTKVRRFPPGAQDPGVSACCDSWA